MFLLKHESLSLCIFPTCLFPSSLCICFIRSASTFTFAYFHFIAVCLLHTLCPYTISLSHDFMLPTSTFLHHSNHLQNVHLYSLPFPLLIGRMKIIMMFTLTVPKINQAPVCTSTCMFSTYFSTHKN